MYRLSVLLVLVAGTAGGQAQSPSLDNDTFFETRVRPVLAGTCFKCHGGEKTSAGLRVDSRQALLKGGDTGPAIVPGKPEKSLLVRALQHTDGADLKMPPGKKLAASVIADLTSWVQRKSAWPEGKPVKMQDSSAHTHWAFRPVVTPRVPDDPQGGSGHPIDRFIAVQQKAHGVKPVGPASKRTLLRRLYFDLIGLPPTPAQMAAFLADDSPDAYTNEVERLLASPLYGECWGRHWMDLVRYADTAGDNADYPVPEAALYRDYIIRAFNTDKPYDEFLREQLAGDLLAARGPREKYAELEIATTYLGLSRRYMTAPYESWELTLEDAIDTTGRAFLGLTLRCARCHDHKFDPVTREDYYALYGIFASTQFPYTGSEEFASMKRPREHFVPLIPPREADPQLAAYRKKIDDLKAEIARREKETQLGRHLVALDAVIEIESKLLDDFLQRKEPTEEVLAELDSHRRQRSKLREKLDKEFRPLRDQYRSLAQAAYPANLPVAYAVCDGKAADVPIQIAGDPARPGKVVPRGVPRFLSDGTPFAIAPGQSGRLELARWIASPSNPLTARVMVNRIWQHHFGRGLVATPSNFGLRGLPPTHPELLDWLAAQFVKSGWSIKAMHRLIVTSRTYQLASSNDPVDAGLDPGNTWLWRFERRRLDAEAIRDAMLAVSGNLELREGGAHPFPPMKAWKWTQHDAFKEVYDTDRRSVYLMTQRLQRHPFLALFDGPDTNVSTDLRTASTVPLQALYLMNNGFVYNQALGLAKQVLRAAPDVPGQLKLAYERAFCRPPTRAEAETANRFLRQFREELAPFHLSPAQQDEEAWASFARVLLCANEFMYLD